MGGAYRCAVLVSNSHCLLASRQECLPRLNYKYRLERGIDAFGSRYGILHAWLAKAADSADSDVDDNLI